MEKDNRIINMEGWSDRRLLLAVTAAPCTVALLALLGLYLVPAPWGNYAFTVLIGFLGLNYVIHTPFLGGASYEFDRRTLGFGDRWHRLTLAGYRVLGVAFIVFAALSLFRTL